MEAAIMNLLEPGDRCVVAVNGAFGGRMADMAGRAGATVVTVDHDWGQPVDPARVEAALAEAPTKVLAFVHAETSTGARSDAASLCAVARKHGALSVVDCVTSLGGIVVDVAGWDADVVYSGTQKCLSAPPGLSPIALSKRAQAAISGRKEKVRNWLLDFNLLMSYWGGEGGRTYHHTAPINALYGLHESLVAIFEEGQQAAIVRHARMHEALVAGIEAAGLSMLVAAKDRLPQLNTVRVPDGDRRGGGARPRAEALGPGDRRGPRAAEGPGLAHRPDGRLGHRLARAPVPDRALRGAGGAGLRGRRQGGAGGGRREARLALASRK